MIGEGFLFLSWVGRKKGWSEKSFFGRCVDFARLCGSDTSFDFMAMRGSIESVCFLSWAFGAFR